MAPEQTFAVLDRLVVKEVVSAMLEDDRISCLRTVTEFVSRFDEFSAVSQQNPGLPGWFRVYGIGFRVQDFQLSRSRVPDCQFCYDVP